VVLHPGKHILQSLSGWLLGALLVSMQNASALAESLITDFENKAQVLRVQTFLGDTGQSQIMIEMVEFEPEGDRIAWIRGFEARPLIENVDVSALKELKALTQISQPHHVGLKARLYQSSIFGHIYHRWQDATNIDTEERERVFIDLAPNAFTLFKGEVITSSITRRRSLPEDLQKWLARNQFDPSPEQHRQLMRLCEKSWFIAAATIDVSSIDPGSIAVLNPMLYETKGDALQYPSAFLTGPQVKFEYWIASAGPKTPQGIKLNIDGTPPKRDNRFSVSFHKSRASAALESGFLGDWNWALKTSLIAAEARLDRSSFASLDFVEAIDLPELPQQNSRGGLADILFCILFGIAPLLFAPESWLLYWIRFQGKLERTRVNPNPLATKLWPFYCIGLGLFWVLSMQGLGRLAGILPLVFGLLSIRTQQTPTGRVLVHFKKPKKSVRARKPPK
jgi:hypothetical protein